MRFLKTRYYHFNSVNFQLEEDITKWRPTNYSAFQEPECLFPKYVKQYKMILPEIETDNQFALPEWKWPFLAYIL